MSNTADERLQAFAWDVMQLDGATVGAEDGRAVVTLNVADPDDVIDATPVYNAASEAGVTVVASKTKFDAGEHVVEVTPDA